MTVETRNNIIAIIAAGTLAGLLGISLIGIIILAVVHDGALATQAMNTFTQIITIAAPAAAALAGVDRVMTGLTASKAISSGAAVQVAQVAQGVTPSPTDSQGVSQSAGNGAVAGDVVEAMASGAV